MSGFFPRRRWRVYCTQFAFCQWAGYRIADTSELAKTKPCPRCGKAVAL